jgi:hypothetical protein
MPTTTTRADAWPPERLDALARGLMPLVFGRPAPTPGPSNVEALAQWRTPSRPSTDAPQT